MTWIMCACSPLAPVGPDYQAPDSAVPSDYKFKSTKNGETAAKRENWWTVFKDSQLNEIIAQVHRSNQEIRAAHARFEQSRSKTSIAYSQSQPRVSTSPSIKRVTTSAGINSNRSSSTQFVLPVDASWEIDLFGKIRRGTEAAIADSEVSAEILNHLKLSLEADATIRYFTIRSIDQEISIVDEEIKGREASLKVIEDRFKVGTVSNLDVSQAKAELAVNQSNLAELSLQRSAQVAALALLTGQQASGFFISYSPLKGSAPTIPNTLPSELLRSRPDIRSAERSIAAANARVGVATAAFYPSISLTGNIGIASNSLNKLLKRRSSMWSIGPEIYLPIFNAGENKAALNFSKARYEEVLADYQQAVLASISEVETRLSATHQLRNQSTALTDAVKAASEARQIAKEQYDGGVTNYLTVLDADRTAFSIERAKAKNLREEYINAVNLIRALGGRW